MKDYVFLNLYFVLVMKSHLESYPCPLIINSNSLYSCLFFFLTGLHFFHLTIGLLLLSLLFWSCSFSIWRSSLSCSFSSLIFMSLCRSSLNMKSIHLEVALESFCFLINSSWLLIFTLIIILFIFTGFNLYCWTGIHFS